MLNKNACSTIDLSARRNAQKGVNMRAIRLKTEFLYNPLGIDVKLPRLQWNCEGGIRQSAYYVLAKDDTGKVLMDSGKQSSNSMQVVWAGAELHSRTQVIWQVKLWDEAGVEGEWSETAFFEIGLLKSQDWKAKWISGAVKVDKAERYPVDCFQKIFLAKQVKKARLYVTACGLYEASLNGNRIGDAVLTPGITDYRKRIQYQTYDITTLLKDGENQITIELADGWYRGSVGAWGLRNQYGTQTKLLAQIELTDETGAVRRVGTNENWQWSDEGPIRFADNKDGEVVDARKTAIYKNDAILSTCDVVPTSSNNVPIREKERFSPTLIKTPKGKTVLDFGQNIAGYVEFHLSAKAGQKIDLRFGEMLDESGEFTQKNIQCSNKKITTPLQQVNYTCKDGMNDYKTKFAIFGFQYLEIETTVAFSPADFTAIAVYSDMEQTMHFDSSNKLLNQFVKSTVWSAKNNSADLPTDCPTRERHGWTGDAQIFCGTASYLFDYNAFARKFIRDMYDWQKPNGCLPQIAPEGGTDFYMKAMNGSVGWADAGVFMPYTLWKQYGDKQILQDYYESMANYAKFMQKRCGKWYPTAVKTGLKRKERKYICNYGQAYGEWAEPADVHTMTWKDCAVPHPEVATAYTACVMERMEEIALVLGKTEDAAAYRQFANNVKRDYQKLAETEKYTLDTDRQARLVRPLAFHLLNKKQTDYARKRLIKALQNYGWRLGTGFLSTPLILDVLTDIDVEYAYRLLENEEIPGWLSMPKNGATTIWEAWEGHQAANGIASLNHYSKGAACEWVFRVMCGIKVAGENHFVVAPVAGGTFTFAGAEYQSVYGKVASSWKRDTAGNTQYTITIPANCSADVILPDGTRVRQESGTKVYSCKKRKGRNRNEASKNSKKDELRG